MKNIKGLFLIPLFLIALIVTTIIINMINIDKIEFKKYIYLFILLSQSLFFSFLIAGNNIESVKEKTILYSGNLIVLFLNIVASILLSIYYKLFLSVESFILFNMIILLVVCFFIIIITKIALSNNNKNVNEDLRKKIEEIKK